MNHLQLVIHDLLTDGTPKSDRTGVGTLSKFGYMQRWDLTEGYPHETAKFTPFMMNVDELLWIISGSTDLAPLKANKINIWDEWVIPGTEVWGAPYTQLERMQVMKEMVERRAIHPEQQQQYLDIWMEHNPGTVMGAREWNDLMDNFNVPKAPLLDGKLGAVYGQQWRNIVDTRIIDPSEEEDYTKRGFEFRGTMLTPEDLASGKCNGSMTIVQRRIDQLQNVINALVNNPDDRGIIVNAWHVPDLDAMALRPCHTLFQFYTRLRDWKDVMTDIQFDDDPGRAADFEEFAVGCDAQQRIKAVYEFAIDKGIPVRHLDLQLYMRSNDSFLGRPFNISQYSLLTMMVAQVVNMLPGDFILMNGDLHLYQNHLEQAAELISREPVALPQVTLNPNVMSIFDFKREDFTIHNYNPLPAIKAPVAK